MKKPSVSGVVFMLAPLFSIPFILWNIHDKKRIGLVLLTIFFGVCVYLYLPDIYQDGGRRYDLYEKFQDLSTHDFFNNYLLHRADYLFYALIYLFAALNIKFQILLFLLGCFNVGIPLFVFNKVISKYKLSNNEYFIAVLLILTSLGLPYIFSGIRQLVGFNFIMLSTYQFFFRKRYFLSVLFVLMGILTHFSVFIFLPLIYLTAKINAKLYITISLIFLITGLILPETYIQFLFRSIDLDSLIYNDKIKAYSNLSNNTASSTLFTVIAKTLKIIWFYFALFYALLSQRKGTKLFKIFLIFLLPISLLISFPGIVIRYIDLLKMIFALVLLDDYIAKRSSWVLFFLLLFSFAPLYDIFRLLTTSLKTIYTLDHVLLYQIIIEKYTFSDVLKISN